MNSLVRLPADPEEIVRRLSTVSGERNLVEKLYRKVAEHAGQEFLPEGILLMLMLTAGDFERQYPPSMGGILVLYMPRWIDALVNNKEVAEEVKGLLEEAKTSAEEDRKTNTPTRVEPQGPTENDSLYSSVRKVADIFFEEVARWDVKHLIDISRRDDGANPFYNQTEVGLFVEYYYGHPSKVWTPWGHFDFVGSLGYRGDAPWDKILDSFIKRLGATLYIPERDEPYGTVGPVYAIHQIDGVKLPEPKVREHQNYLEYNIAKNAWENMTKRYNTILQRIWRKLLSIFHPRHTNPR